MREAVDEAFRDDQGNSTNHPGLKLHLSDFAFEELVQEELGDQDRDTHIWPTALLVSRCSGE